jgi:lysophospholipase L1-like esterase
MFFAQQRWWSSIVLIFSLAAFCGAGEDSPKVIEIIALGDSITKGVRTGVLAEETFAAGLERTLKDRGFPVRVTNIGIGGERTDQALTRLEKDVLSRKPQIVTIMYGTNDSYVDKGQTDSRITAEAYRKNLEALVQRMQAAGIRPVLMTEPRWGAKATLNGAGEHPNIRLERYLTECRAAATALKVPLVDHYSHWTKAEAAGQNLGDWTTDQCHPNPAGHRVLLETMLPVIEKAMRELTTSD